MWYSEKIMEFYVLKKEKKRIRRDWRENKIEKVNGKHVESLNLLANLILSMVH